MLIALVARADASPAEDPRAQAIRYANILTGVEPDDDPTAGSDLDEEDDDDERGVAYDAEEEGDDDQRDGHDGDAELGDRDAPSDDPDGIDDHGALAQGDGVLDDEPGGDGSGAGGSDRLLDDDDGDPDRLASLEGAAWAPDEPAPAGHVTGELAALDVGAADPGTVSGDDAGVATAVAGAAETYESWMRHQRPSRWGRLDVGVEWRRRWSEPMQALSHRYDEVWLVATWRR